MHLIDGKKIASKIETSLKRSKRKGGLAVILVGNNPASKLYVALKEKAARRTGINFEKIIFPASSNISLTKKRDQEKQILNKISKLNSRPDISGIIVQLPLPKYLDTDKIIKAIDPKKDADGYHPENIKKFQNGNFPFYPPVLGAILEILNSVEPQKNKNIVLVSNSKIFPIPFQSYFGKNLTVSKFKDIKRYLPQADIIITAVGKQEYLKAALVKKGTVIIDIGIIRKNKKVYGDADQKSLKNKASYLTPVPGGVGPITVACLLKNVKK